MVGQVSFHPNHRCISLQNPLLKLKLNTDAEVVFTRPVKDLPGLLQEAESQVLTQELFEQIIDALNEYTLTAVLNHEYETRLRLQKLFHKVLANKTANPALHDWLMANKGPFLHNQFLLLELALKERTATEVDSLLNQIHEGASGKLKRISDELSCPIPEKRTKTTATSKEKGVAHAFLEKVSEATSECATGTAWYAEETVRRIKQAWGFFASKVCKTMMEKDKNEFKDHLNPLRCTNSKPGTGANSGYVEAPLFLKQFKSGGIFFVVKEFGDPVSSGSGSLLNGHFIDGWVMQNYPLQNFWKPYNADPSIKYDFLGNVRNPLEPYGGLHELIFFISYDDGNAHLLKAVNYGPITADMIGAPSDNNFPPDYVIVSQLSVITAGTSVISLLNDIKGLGNDVSNPHDYFPLGL